MVGRFIGAALMQRVRPGLLLSIFAVIAASLVVTSLLTSGLLALLALLAVGLFNSIMFPTIFSIAIEDLDDLKPQGSGVLCTAIAGGAFIPPLYGFFTDAAGFKTAFILLLVCYFYIWFYGKTFSSPAVSTSS